MKVRSFRCAVYLGALLSLSLSACFSDVSEPQVLPDTSNQGLSPTNETKTPQPKLIVQITVDQLRGDLPLRYQQSFSENGFNLFLEQGVSYLNAHHPHAVTETVVGHATLATGAWPSHHGMIANNWFDRTTGQLVYNVEDADYHLVPKVSGIDQDTEIDPTQKIANADGRSPRNLAVTTFADELSLATNGAAKIFAVSVKDRGAITMAGHAGKAFWFSKSAAQFVSSSYYYNQLPNWAAELNAQELPSRYENTSWTLSGPVDSYLFGANDDQAWEADLAGFSRTFPHGYGSSDSPYFTTLLTVSPAGDELTVDFAKEIISAENLGSDAVTDYLSLSLSSTDYIGHVFGHGSLEQEDNLRRLDALLADFFAYIEAEVGLSNTLIVLSADHGSPRAAGRLTEYGFNDVSTDVDRLFNAENSRLWLTEIGLPINTISAFSFPFVYLNHEAIAQAGISKPEGVTRLQDFLSGHDAVYQAIDVDALLAGDRAVNSELERRVLNNLHPARSGELFLVLNPQRFINDFDGLIVPVTHGSPWRYDTHVPIYFAGFGLTRERVVREVSTTAIASTLALSGNTALPSAAFSEPLEEVSQ
jgi:predicted AlkP superfamily pyrophosphatase or phosphodiesterase